MSIFVINKKQLLRLCVAASDAFLPIWRIIRIPILHRDALNPLYVILFLAAIISVGELSPFPPSVVMSENGHLIEIGVRGLRYWLVNIKTAVMLVSIFIVLLSFLLDLHLEIVGAEKTRFMYADKEHSKSERAWWSLVLLMTGYIARILLFGICAATAVGNSNIRMLARNGLSIFGDMNWPVPSGDILNSALTALSSPLRDWTIIPRGDLIVSIVMGVIALAKVIIATFLLGTFSIIVNRMHFLQSGKSQTPQS